MADVVYLVRDLLFTSKIREVVKQRGLASQSAPDPAALAAASSQARLVVLDLRADVSLQALRALVDAGVTAPRIGFCDHERVERMDEAKALGCTHVVTKGQFARTLADLLA